MTRSEESLEGARTEARTTRPITSKEPPLGPLRRLRGVQTNMRSTPAHGRKMFALFSATTPSSGFEPMLLPAARFHQRVWEGFGRSRLADADASSDPINV